MKEKIILCGIVLVLWFSAQSQPFMINNGAYIRINGNTNMNISGTEFSLQNQNNGNIELYGNLSVGNNFVNDADLLIGDGGSLIEVNTMSGSGNSIVQRLIHGGEAHYLSQPVAYSSANVFVGGFVFEYLENEAAWAPVETNINTQVMKGFSVEFLNDNTIEFEGAINSGPLATNITNLGGGWNLVGNPYPSAIDWDAEGWIKQNVDNTVYYWNGNNYSYYVGAGGAVPDQGSLYVNNGTNVIPAMQGFFVKASSNGQLGVTNDVRIHDDLELNKKTKIDYSYLRLIAEGNNYADETLIVENESSTTGFDSRFDAYKLFTTVEEVPQLYSIEENQGLELAIQSFPVLNEEKTIPLGFKSGVNGSYSIDVADMNIPFTNELYLEDKKEMDVHDLKNNGEYTFHYSTNDPPGRFLLHFKKTSVGVVGEITSEWQVYASGHFVYIKNNHNMSNEKVYVEIYDLSGRIIHSEPISRHQTDYRIDLQGSVGVFFVQVISNLNSVNQKVVLQ